MKKNINFRTISIIFATLLICCGIAINLAQKAEKSDASWCLTVVTENGVMAVPMEEPEFTFEEPYNVLHHEKWESTIDGKTFEYEISNVRKWTVTGPVYGRIMKTYENGQLTSETHTKTSR